MPRQHDQLRGRQFVFLRCFGAVLFMVTSQHVRPLRAAERGRGGFLFTVAYAYKCRTESGAHRHPDADSYRYVTQDRTDRNAKDNSQGGANADKRT